MSVYAHVHARVPHLKPKAKKGLLGELSILLFYCDSHTCLGYLLEATRRTWLHTPLGMWVAVLCARHCAKFFTSTLIYSIRRPYQVSLNLFQWLGNGPERAEPGLDLMPR